MNEGPGSEVLGLSPVALAVIPAPHLRGETLGLPLSKREWEVLAAYARTGHQGQAATVLGIARQTVRNYLTQIYAKRGVAGAIDAFRVVGWLRVPGDIAA